MNLTKSTQAVPFAIIGLIVSLDVSLVESRSSGCVEGFGKTCLVPREIVLMSIEGVITQEHL